MLKNKNKKIRYAVVGLGYIAQVAVLPAFKNANKNSELKALVSGSRDKLNYLGKKYKVDKCYLYSEFEECLRQGEVDAVFIATPNFYHRSLTEIAAKYGVHVLCEKPMAVTSADCLSMINAAEKNHIKLMIAYRLHFEAANLRAIEAIKEEKIGDPKIFNSVFTMQIKDKNNIRLDDTENGGGPLYDIGVYCINAARYLFRQEPIEVFAMSTSSDDERFKNTEETISCILKFSDHRLANFTISFGAFDSADYDIIGTKGRIRLENGYEYATPITLRTFSEKRDGSIKYPQRDQFAPELIYFSDCIMNDHNPEPSGEEGLADIRIIEAIMKSLETNAPVRLGHFSRSERPAIEQKITRPPFSKPELFKANGPSGEDE